MLIHSKKGLFNPPRPGRKTQNESVTPLRTESILSTTSTFVLHQKLET
jgi:hypothetical protein